MAFAKLRTDLIFIIHIRAIYILTRFGLWAHNLDPRLVDDTGRHHSGLLDTKKIKTKYFEIFLNPGCTRAWRPFRCLFFENQKKDVNICRKAKCLHSCKNLGFFAIIIQTGIPYPGPHFFKNFGTWSIMFRDTNFPDTTPFSKSCWVPGLHFLYSQCKPWKPNEMKQCVKSRHCVRW